MSVEALIGSVIRALTPFLQLQLSPIFDASEDVHKLSSSLITIKVVLNDAERKQIGNEPLQVWLQKLKDVAYEVDDMLDEWNTKKLIEEIKKTNSMNQVSNHSVRCLCDVCYFLVGQRIDGVVLTAQMRLFNLKMGISMGGKIKKIRQKLEMICQERIAFGLTCNGYVENDMIDRETSSLLDESNPIFGRDDEKEQIIKNLIPESSREEEDVCQKKLPVLAIIGMGGLGKTTLAQATYNDERVNKHFDIKIWVSIYDNFDVKKITLKILESAKVTASDRESLDLLQSRLQEVLNEKKFLLVMDNVWNQDHMKWERLRIPLISGERQESRVIITTRSRRVAETMGTNFPLDLKELLYDHCWSLFKSRAFDGRKVEEHPDLKAIGRMMVKKLKGVPLYAKVVGGVMGSKQRKEEWEELLNNEIWEEKEVANGIFPALLLSYYDLSSQLKQCFTFCSVFSKGHVIEKEKIIQLWMAHGFLESDGRRDLEETGQRYLNDLVGRSLLQDLGNDVSIYSNTLRFKLHDLLHDLAQYVGRNECSIFERTSINPISLTKCHHSTLILSEGDSSIFVTLPKANNLRTLLLFGDYQIVLVQTVLFDKLIFLRALDLSYSKIKKLDSSIGKLRHLRYLNLEGSDIEELPEELTDLCNLQTLNLSCCINLSIVPQEISKMRSLRYFSVTYNKLRHLPEGVGRLSSLRHLMFYNDKYDMGIKMRELKELNNLLRLSMDGLEKVRNDEEVREAQLEKKKQLRDLHLRWKDWSREELIRLGDDDVERMEKVLDAFHPQHNNLSSIEIKNFPGCRFPTWISMLNSCTTVTLWNCKKCKELPSLGLLLSLKFLTIWGCESVTHVSSTFFGMGMFPKLQNLCFFNMLKLEEMEMRMDDGEMPCLQLLSLEGCPQLKRLPQRLPPTLQELWIMGCPYLFERYKKEGGVDWPKIAHIPHIIVGLDSVTHVSSTSYGMGIFPKLQLLEFYEMLKVEEMELRMEDGEMPCLQGLNIWVCPLLKRLPQRLPPTLQTLYNLECPLPQRLPPTLQGL